MGKNELDQNLRDFKNALEKVGIRVEKLILFGSHASGVAHEASDIDLVVISSDFVKKSYWERIEILTDAIMTVMAPLEATALTPDEWNSTNSFISDYAKNGVEVI